MSESGATPKFEYQTPEEISQLPVIGGDDETDGSASEPGYVYLMWEDGTKNFKIGRTNNPERRRRELQTGNSRNLPMRYVPVSNMAAAEGAVKNAMKLHCKHIQEGGKEWFRPERGDSKEYAEQIFMDTVKGSQEEIS